MPTPPDGRNDLAQIRRDVAADWSSVNPILAAGEPGYDTTNNILKVGDGTTAWNDLPGYETVEALNGRYGALDEDDFASDSATLPPSQQSVAEYTAATFTLRNFWPKPVASQGLPVPPGTTQDTAASALDRLAVFPVMVPHPVTIDQLGIYITTGEATSVCRLGLYSPAANGRPGALLVDAGTVDCSTTGPKIATIGSPVNVTTGLVYFAYCFQTASTSVRFRRYTYPGGVIVGAPGTSTNVFQGSTLALSQESVSGALPDPMVPLGGGAGGLSIPVHFLRVSALL